MKSRRLRRRRLIWGCIVCLYHIYAATAIHLSTRQLIWALKVHKYRVKGAVAIWLNFQIYIRYEFYLRYDNIFLLNAVETRWISCINGTRQWVTVVKDSVVLP